MTGLGRGSTGGDTLRGSSFSMADRSILAVKGKREKKGGCIKRRLLSLQNEYAQLRIAPLHRMLVHKSSERRLIHHSTLS